MQSICVADSQCSALHTNLTSFLMGSSSLVFDFIRFLERTISSTVFGNANVLKKQACLTRTCVGVAVNCKHIPMSGLQGELHSSVIPRQKGCNESEMTAKSITRPRPVVHVCPTSRTTILAFWPKLCTQPISHNWSGSMLKSAAITNGVRIECVNSKICANLTVCYVCYLLVCGSVGHSYSFSYSCSYSYLYLLPFTFLPFYLFTFLPFYLFTFYLHPYPYSYSYSYSYSTVNVYFLTFTFPV